MMRSITIHRPKRMMASLTKMVVEIDGKKVDKLANGQAFSTQIDDNGHEVHIHFGKLAGKSASFTLTIPAGSYSYTFHTEIMELTNGSKPVLLPGGVPDREPSRVVQLMVSSLTCALLDPKLQNPLATIPDARLRLVLEEQQWGLAVCAGAERKTLLVQPFSQRRGSLLAVATNALEHGDLRTPEGREKFAQMIFANYLQYLPEYTCIGNRELVLNKQQ